MSERFWFNTGQHTIHYSCTNVSTNLNPAWASALSHSVCSLPPPGLRSLSHLVWLPYHERESLPVVGYKEVLSPAHCKEGREIKREFRVLPSPSMRTACTVFFAP